MLKNKLCELLIKIKSVLAGMKSTSLYKILTRPLVVFLICCTLAGALTSVVFLNRAGSNLERNWPVNWNVKNSDNSVLYQFSDDVYKGRSLDWTFSPQVYVFPEIPVSLASYGLAGGDPYLYFIFVAIINNVLIFMVLYGLSKMMATKRTSQKEVMSRAFLAFTPLLVLPLLTDNTVFFYHLAPTYYFGAYLFYLAFPIIIFSKISVKKKMPIYFGYVLTAASNPLLLIFTLPTALIITFFSYLRDGLKPSISRFVVPITSLAIASIVFRKVFFSKIAAINPTSYISVESFRGRLGSLELLIDSILNSRIDRIFALALLASLLTCVFIAITSLRRYISNGDSEIDNQTLTKVFLGVSPLLTGIVLYLLLIINPLYLWPLVTAPMVIAPLIFLKGKYVKGLVISAYLLMALICLLPKSIDRYSNTNRYFDYKSDLTNCLDNKLPSDTSVGYATFSDARKTEITSDKDILLIQLLFNGGVSGWLTNTKYSKEYPGSFFVINYKGDEKPIEAESIFGLFGDPDGSFYCNDDVRVLVYSDEVKLL